jgi:hypothetical protein
LKRLAFLTRLVMCASLAGCSQATLMRMLVPPQDEANAKGYVELLQERKFDQIEQKVETGFLDANSRDILVQMADVFPDQTPQSVKVVGADSTSRNGDGTADITLEYQFPRKWVLVSVRTLKMNGATTILGFHVKPLEESLEDQYRFTLNGKSGVQYSILALGVSSLLFSFYAFALCLRTKIEKRKWLWLVISLVGVFRLAVDWTTGRWAFTLLGISIPCIVANHPLYGPWTVGAYFPLGAVLFLDKRWKMKIRGELIPPLANDSTDKAASA